MKEGMKMPGFTAEASIYKSNGHYMMGGVTGEITKPLVSTATAYGNYGNLLAQYQTQFLIDLYFGGWGSAGWGGGGGGGASYWTCRASCINKNCLEQGMSAGEIARCISDCEKTCRK